MSVCDYQSKVSECIFELYGCNCFKKALESMSDNP